jgi:hypothetical protein
MFVVYVLSNPAMPSLVKIGRTIDDGAASRIAQLYTTGVPFPFVVEFACRVANPDEVERALHTAFAPQRVNSRREFFEIDPQQAIAILRLLHVQDATADLTTGSSSDDAADANAGMEYRSRRPNIHFQEMGIPIGAELVSTIDGSTAIVTGPRKVLFQGDDTSLTAATRTILQLDYNVAPGPYWRYQNQLVRELYDQTYPSTS